ncbi:uncharacterized protein [Branchiostoma lanceolatum]|uniref:uncharacterized protein n=1 Tax=Branchiostoma lanceolatum TaxID=7740 RepID=UPI0034555114
MEWLSMFEYKGAYFGSLTVAKETLDMMPDYVIRDDDVVILTYPKAGTNWTIEIVNKLMRAAGKTDILAKDIPWFIEGRLPDFGKPGHVIVKDHPSPRIVHTHLPRHLAPKMISNPTGKVKVIMVMRNPKDTAVSLYHYLEKYQVLLLGTASVTTCNWDKFAQDFLDGFAPFGDFYDHALGWWQMKDDPHFLFLKYEDMKKDVSSAVGKMKEFLDITLDDVTTSDIVESCTIASLKAAWTESGATTKSLIARKGVVGDWKNTFTVPQSEAYDAKYKEKLEGTGLQFDFEFTFEGTKFLVAWNEIERRRYRKDALEMERWFKYKGAYFDPLLVTKETLDMMPDYVIRDDDVVILTYPKAGTNWTIEIVNKLMRAAGKTDMQAKDIPWFIAGTLPEFGQPGHLIVKDHPSPRIVHTHLPWHLAPKMISNPKGKVKVIMVMRNPKDTAVSLYRFLEKFKDLSATSLTTATWEKCAQDFLDGIAPHGDFYDHALGWWQMRDDPHFLFLKYEDMKKDLSSAVGKIKGFLDITLDDVTTSDIVESCAIASLKAAWTESGAQTKSLIARKGVVGDWKNTFTVAQSEAYDAKYREKLEGTGLQFDFE